MPVHQTFADVFTREIKQYHGAGAGIPIKTNAKGDAVTPFEVSTSKRTTCMSGAYAVCDDDDGLL